MGILWGRLYVLLGVVFALGLIAGFAGGRSKFPNEKPKPETVTVKIGGQTVELGQALEGLAGVAYNAGTQCSKTVVNP